MKSGWWALAATVGNPVANMAVFAAVGIVAVVVMVWAGHAGRDVDSGRGLSVGQGAAITGDFLAAGAVLGITGALFAGGAPALVYPVGFALGALVGLPLAATAAGRAGCFTTGQLLSARTRPDPVRAAAAVSTLVVALIVLVAELVGAEALLAALLGVPRGDVGAHAGLIAAAGAVMTAVVLVGGISGAGATQRVKTTLLLATAAALTVCVLVAGGLAAVRPLAGSGHAGGSAIGVTGLGTGLVGVLDVASVGVALTLGAGALAHLLPRYSTIAPGRRTRRAGYWAAGLTGAFVVLAALSGLGAHRLIPAGVAGTPGGVNATVAVLGMILGGPLLGGVVAAVAFVAITAAVAAVAVTAAASFAHDLYPTLRGRGSSAPRQVASAVALVLGVAAIAAAVAARGQNTALLIGWAFAVAASASLPTLVYSLRWKAFTTTGAVCSIYGGLALSVVLIVLSPPVSGTPTSMISTADFAVFGLSNPALVSIPVSFLFGYAGSLLGAPESAGAGAPVPPARNRRRWVVMGAVLVVAVVIAAGVLAYQADQHAGSSVTATTGGDDVSAAAALGWLATNPPSGPVLSDPGFRTDLIRTGFDPTRLATPSACTPTACPPDWLVSTPALRAHQAGDPALGALMAASRPVAVFGTATHQISIRAPGAPDPAREAAEHHARVTVGAALAGLDRIDTSAPLRGLLAAGQVDPRVLAMLATLAQRGPVQVLDLPAVPGEDVAGTPRRQLVLGIDPRDPEVLPRFFAAQTGPYHPATITPIPSGLLAAYPPIAPPGLLDAFAGP